MLQVVVFGRHQEAGLAWEKAFRGDAPLVKAPAPRRREPPPARPGVIAGDVLFIPKKATSLADVRVEDPVSAWSECWVEVHVEDGQIIVEAAGACEQAGTIPSVVRLGTNEIGDDGAIGTRYFADCRFPRG